MSHPDQLLRSLAWTCDDTVYASPEAFSTAIRDYQIAIFKSDERWRPDEVLLASPRVTVYFECWEGDDQFERPLELASDDPRGFTTLALMYGIHQGIAAHLRAHAATLGDHCFFEGLVRRDDDAEQPSYDIRFGS
jgi:hypothetical protein